MKMFDSHAHYDDAKFDGIADEIIKEVHSAGVEKITNIGASLASSEASLRLAQKYDFFYAAVGVHPSDAPTDMQNPDWLNLVEKMYNSSEKAVAVGEIGLDYHYGKDYKDLQLECFRLQMKLAQTLNAPVVVHDREAHEDTLRVLSEFPDVKCVLHSFSGSYEMAKEILKMGNYISVNGVITFSNARKTVDVFTKLHELGDEAYGRVMLETDCPYLTPVPYRGKTNRSDYMKYTAQKAAECMGIAFDEFCNLTYRNACEFYGIND